MGNLLSAIVSLLPPIQDCETPPVFLVIGLGGTPDAPEHVYCIPLEAMNGNTLTFEDVRPYWKKIAERSTFFWDHDTRMLR